jgi:hypothetical protein
MDTDAGGFSQRTLLDVAREVVAECAPEELPLVNGLSRFDDRTVRRRLAQQGGHREPLGFGVDAAAVLVVSIVWTAIQDTADTMVRATAESAIQRAVRWLGAASRRLLRPLFRGWSSGGPRKREPLPHFGGRELAEVRRRVLESARENGLSQHRAERLADCVAVRLAIGSAADDWPDEERGVDPNAEPGRSQAGDRADGPA